MTRQPPGGGQSRGCPGRPQHRPPPRRRHSSRSTGTAGPPRGARGPREARRERAGAGAGVSPQRVTAAPRPLRSAPLRAGPLPRACAEAAAAPRGARAGARSGDGQGGDTGDRRGRGRRQGRERNRTELRRGMCVTGAGALRCGVALLTPRKRRWRWCGQVRPGPGRSFPSRPSRAQLVLTHPGGNSGGFALRRL